MNVGNPGAGLRLSRSCPTHGVGLARLEFIINRQIGIHPMALLHLDEHAARTQARRSASASPRYASPRDFYVEHAGRGRRHHRRGVRAGAGDRAPVRLQVQRIRQPDRRRALRAARREPDDRLPRRLALPRAVASGTASTLECEALKLRPRRDGPDQRQADDPVRAHRWTRPAASSTCWRRTACTRGENGLEVIMMCEIPSNALLADEFLELLRRLLDRLQRHDPADPGPGPRLRRSSRRLRRARPGRQEAAEHGHRGLHRRAASTSASAARVRATTRTSPSGWSRKASTRSR